MSLVEIVMGSFKYLKVRNDNLFQATQPLKRET